jgi:transcription-repair coupling factor (superfamily II helicase)
LAFITETQPPFLSNFKRFSANIFERRKQGFRVLISIASKKEQTDLEDFLQQEELVSGTDFAFTNAVLYAGFISHDANVCVYCESEVFGKLHRHKKSRTKKSKLPISLRDLRALKEGDFLVHSEYGIGRFGGMETVTVAGSVQECILLYYLNDDKLFVNVSNINYVSKFSSAEGKVPTLSKLGSPAWQAQKERTKKRIKDIARKLITLYAKRKAEKGTAFPSDSIWQREFEAAFVFDETPDQFRAIEETKKDMTSNAPMDRLICGDVGFGKTEVAMRAAFKATEGGKQVAMLVPTTILAHQHFNSFKSRFQNFPTRIEVLSRFVPKVELKKIAKDIENGLVDIVIGTHRLISKDVKFKHLGLLMIDEEHRFGVAAKEKLREDFPGVDTLTLTATPIPRTLQFSMMGARDLSIISTPPVNRQPIETIVDEFDEGLIQKAIERELARGGQVFFLHNRVQSIEQIYDLVKKLFPKARVRVGHGQMSNTELEEVMLDFVQKEADILICTTIIESGLDISNANTIIINRADMFGLAELYQLRGRVGRSNQKAYCYLLTPPFSVMTKDALQRLAVIEEYTELGSGTSVAMRDLDIRGAGNLLGSEQSGFIYELGFDLYQKILEEAVAELKLTEFKALFNEADVAQPEKKLADISFFFDALIPSFYIESAAERFGIYDKIANARTLAAMDKIKVELQDRFGKLPDVCQHLFLANELKLLTSEVGFAKTDIAHNKVSFQFPDANDKAFYDLPSKDGQSKFAVLMQRVQSPASSQVSI